MSRRIICTILFVAVAVFALLAFSSGILSAQESSQDAFQRAREAQERHANGLLAIDGVEGTAIGLDENGQLVETLDCHLLERNQVNVK